LRRRHIQTAEGRNPRGGPTHKSSDSYATQTPENSTVYYRALPAGEIHALPKKFCGSGHPHTSPAIGARPHDSHPPPKGSPPDNNLISRRGACRASDRQKNGSSSQYRSNTQARASFPNRSSPAPPSVLPRAVYLLLPTAPCAAPIPLV